MKKLSIPTIRSITISSIACVMACVLFTEVYITSLHPLIPVVEPHVYITGANGSGSGTLIAPNKVLTARHVVHLNFARDVKVFTSDDKSHVVEDILFLQQKDAAILILADPVKVKRVTLTEDTPSVGHWAHFTGSPQGFMHGYLFREGYVASTQVYQDLRYQMPMEPFPDAHNYELLMVMTHSAPGDSGSGVLDEHGNLFGIVVTASNAGWTGVLPVASFKDLLW